MVMHKDCYGSSYCIRIWRDTQVNKYKKQLNKLKKQVGMVGPKSTQTIVGIITDEMHPYIQSKFQVMGFLW